MELDFSCDSDGGDHSPKPDCPNPINDFMSNYLDIIIDIAFDFREHFGYNPFFLEHMQSTHLTEFFINHFVQEQPDLVHKIEWTMKTCPKFEEFVDDYYSELASSFKAITSLGKTIRKNDPVTFSDWCKFCFCYSNIDDL